MNYLITFACYGCHLHGDEAGSVDRRHNLPGGRLIEADPKRVATERKSMVQPPYSMDRNRREAVLAALRERCSERRWSLWAAHVRTNRSKGIQWLSSRRLGVKGTAPYGAVKKIPVSRQDAAKQNPFVVFAFFAPLREISGRLNSLTAPSVAARNRAPSRD